MQTIVCQTAETFAADLTPQPQILQKPQDSGEGKSDFLSMLNENLQKESGAQESSPGPSVENEREGHKAELSSAGSEGKAVDGEPKELEKSSIKEKGGEKKVAKKNSDKDSENSSRQKVDAFIQGALGPDMAQKSSEPRAPKIGKESGGKKIATEIDGNKIDPKQLEFLKNLVHANNLDADQESKALDAKELLVNDEAFAAAQLSAQESLAAQTEAAMGAEDFGQDNSLDDISALLDEKSLSGKKDAKKPVIQVSDLRTKKEPDAIQKPLEKDVKKNFNVSVKEVAKGNVEMTLELNGQEAQKNILSLDSQSAAADGSTFQAMLKNQIAQNAGDFVKAANIVLRDNDQGQINLILRPEGLGNVKITMEMNGKSLVGHITVQSREAMEAFGQNAESLKQAFAQNGFEDASFDVSFAGSQMNFAQGQGADDSRERAAQGRKIYGEFAQESLTSLDESSDTFIDGDVSVNIVA